MLEWLEFQHIICDASCNVITHISLFIVIHENFSYDPHDFVTDLQFNCIVFIENVFDFRVLGAKH